MRRITYQPMVSAKQWQTGPPLFGLHLNGLFTFGLSLIGLQVYLNIAIWTTYDVWPTTVWTTPQIDYTQMDYI